MGKEWDGFETPGAFERWTYQWALGAYRVLKPGGHLIAFASSRTFHRAWTGIEDAGFELRDTLSWLHAQGFPKSKDVAFAIDQLNGVTPERRAAGSTGDIYGDGLNVNYQERARREPVTPAAASWDGWGTALKPGWEPILLARKPFPSTIARNVLTHGTGALNIDGCRVEAGRDYEYETAAASDFAGDGGWKDALRSSHAAGRWPPNVILDEEAAALLDAQTGDLGLSAGVKRDSTNHVYGGGIGACPPDLDGARIGFGDRGGASRFFFTPKASHAERESWGRLKGAPQRRSDGRTKDIENPRLRTSARINSHPTVKPIELMAWLVRLVTPPTGLVLDPFAGSGTTLIAAKREGFRAMGIEMDEGSARVAAARLGAQYEVKLL